MSDCKRKLGKVCKSSVSLGNGGRHASKAGRPTCQQTLTADAPQAKLQDAFDIWQQKVGDIMFTQTLLANVAVDFEVKTGGAISQWSLDKKTLFLKGSETLGATLHEVGHLLGLSHEQDRPDRRNEWYKNSPSWELEGAVKRGLKLAVYGDYDQDSIMQYPESKYLLMTEPSPGDVTAVKTINGW